MASSATMRDDVGIGLRGPHYTQIEQDQPSIGFLEIHAENFFGGGRTIAYLDRVRQHYPLSIHGTALSLGSAEGIDRAHLEQLAALVEKTDPLFISEHVSWSHAGGIYTNDLLPLPYTAEALEVLCRNIDQVQSRLKRRILMENPSTYLTFDRQEMHETDFLCEMTERTGCGLLLDVNNIIVSLYNLGGNLDAYLANLPWDEVQEIHLAGHADMPEEGGSVVKIDDHGSRVSDEVWACYHQALTHLQRPVHSLIEWDTDVPDLSVLLGEARKAEAMLREHPAIRETRHAA